MLDEDLRLRLVVPASLIDEVFLNGHDSVEGENHGIVRKVHRVKSDYCWTRINSHVTKHIQACEDCSTTKSTPHVTGNLRVTSYRPAFLGSINVFCTMIFFIALSVTQRENTEVLLFQDHLTDSRLQNTWVGQRHETLRKHSKKTSSVFLELPA